VWKIYKLILRAIFAIKKAISAMINAKIYNIIWLAG